MIQINLLDWRIRKQRIRLKKLIIAAVALLLITVISSLVYLHTITSFNQTIHTDIAQRQQAIQHITIKLNSTKDQLNKLSWLQTQAQKINQLEKSKQVLLKFLIMLSHEIPHDLWLTTLQHNSRQLILEGYSLHYASIADFVTRLKQHAFSQHLNIKHINQPHSTIEQLSYLAFKLEAK